MVLGQSESILRLDKMRKKMKHRAIAMIAVVVSLVLSTGTPNFAQSVADAARQERERKRQLALHAVHVYTNEDLSKPHILVPEDEARIAGRVNEPVGAETAVNAEPPAPVAPLVVMPAQAAAPDIADIATAVVSLPEAVKSATNVVLLSSDSNSAPPLATRHVRSDAPAVAAHTQVPVTVGEISIPSTTMPFAAADAYGPANLVLPVSVSKPLVREAGSRLQTQPVPLSMINTPSTTLPFATAEAYNPAKPALPAVVSKPILKTREQSSADADGRTHGGGQCSGVDDTRRDECRTCRYHDPGDRFKTPGERCKQPDHRNRSSGAGQFLSDQYPRGGNAFRHDGYLWSGKSGHARTRGAWGSP